MEDKKTEAVCRYSANNTIIGIITARGGSKGIPLKNLYPLCGTPLLQYTIECAKESGIFDKIIVTTDNDKIKEFSLSMGVEVVDRPEVLSGDLASSADTVAHTLEVLERSGMYPDYFVLLQPTSPLRTAKHLRESLRMFFDSKANSCISVTETEHSPYKMLNIEDGMLLPLFNINSLHQPRQMLPEVYRQNGAIYIAAVDKFKQMKTFYIPPSLPYIMKQKESIDIDSLEDIKEAEKYIMRGDIKI